MRWGPGQRGEGKAHDVAEVVRQINALGYGLTLGVQTRIDSRARRVADAARIGNIYVNRNMIGAVVRGAAVRRRGVVGHRSEGRRAALPVFAFAPKRP